MFSLNKWRQSIRTAQCEMYVNMSYMECLGTKRDKEDEDEEEEEVVEAHIHSRDNSTATT